jgi:outer membrane protein TolC
LFAGDAEAQDSAGVTTYLEVITAQTAAPTNQINVMDVLTRRMTASVLLIKALGGGWTMIADLAHPR